MLVFGIGLFALSVGYTIACDRLFGETAMIFDYTLAAAVSAAMMICLVYALLRPERF